MVARKTIEKARKKRSPAKAEVLLINPPSGLFYGLGPNFAPIGLFSLAAVLRRNGYPAQVLNANYFPDYQTNVKAWAGGGQPRPENYYYAEDLGNPVWEQVLAFIEAVRPKIAGFSCHDLAVGGIKLLSRIIKDRWPEMTVVVGGATPSGAPEIFDDCRHIDYLVAGEGEITVLALARHLLGRRKTMIDPVPEGPSEPILGLYQHDGRRFVFNGPRPAIADLDQLPDPELDCFWLDYSSGKAVRDFQLNGVATSRGCLKTCRFCGARTIWPGPVRYRSIDRVVAEVARLRAAHGYNFQHFSIFDDDFLAWPERVGDFCQRLEALGDDFIFRCYGRVNNLQDETIIETLFKAGCQEIWVGVESGSLKVLKALGKGITVAQIKKLDRLFKNYDFPWLAFIILGTPSETEADIMATLSMLRQGFFPGIQPFTFQPYTGTVLFEEMKALGLVNYTDIIRGHQSLPQYFSPRVPKELFFEYLEELQELAVIRRTAWERAFRLTPEERLTAQAWENQVLDYLRQENGLSRALIVGPERQLRWLAALNHYQGPGRQLTLLDLEAEQATNTRYGRLTPRDKVMGSSWEELLIIAPPDEAAAWQARAVALGLGRPVTRLAQAAGRPPEAPLFWRPVFEICRKQPARADK